MPSDPEHHLDKPLRAYARKRREDAGEPALHPATRRMLQSEAARLRSQPGPGRALWNWAAWPRLAFAAAVCVVLGVLLWNVLPDRQGTPSSRTLALMKPAEVEKLDRVGEEKALGLRPDDSSGLGQSNKDEKQKEKSASPRPRFLELEDTVDVPALRTSESRLARTLAEPAPAGQPAPDSSLRAVPNATRSQVESLAADALSVQSNFNKPITVDAMKRSEFDLYGVALAPKASTSQPFFGGAQLSESIGKPSALADGVSVVRERNYRESIPPGAPPAAPVTAPLASTPVPPPAPVPAGAEASARGRSYAVPTPQRTLAPTAEMARMKYLPGAVTLTQTQQRLRYQRSEAAGMTIAARRGGVATPLAFFDFEQSGERVRLIDADGSVYEGSTSATNAAAFRVFGTNRANGKPLTVDGEFVSESAVVGAAAGTATRFSVNSRGQRATPPAAPGAGAPPPAIVELPAGRALYLNIRPEGVAETRSLAVPAVK